MSVKRFVAADMRRALELVRQEMGPEAIILSSRRVKQGVELLTSLQQEPPRQKTAADAAVTGVEVPMSSDGAWRDQALVDKAISNHSALMAGQPDRSNSATQGVSTNSMHRAASAERGPASGKTPEELADEMERARERMLAARRSSAHTSDGQRPGSQERASTHSSLDRSDRIEVGSDHRGRARADEERSSLDWRATPPVSERALAASADQQLQLESLQSELADMRLLLEEQLSRMSHTPQLGTATHTGLMRRFKHMGFVDASAQRIVNSVANTNTMQEAWTDAQRRLADQLPVSVADPVMAGGVFAFVGPTGVGKTTTIAKLAARYALEHGSENVALVTTDTYRIAAHEQLRSLGRTLNVQVKVVDDNQDLPYVLRSLKGCPLVLIDTAGFRQGDAQLKEQLDIVTEVEGVKTILVMACNSQLQMMKASVHAHQSADLYGCTLTKLDETASLGEALSVILEHNLPVCYTTNGQEIPQDIDVAKSHKLVASAVSLMKSGMGSLAHFPSSSNS